MAAIERWWEPRRDNEPTSEFLARVLDELGAEALAANARAYHYDDYFCPIEIDDGANMPRLVTDVEKWAAVVHTVHSDPRRRARARARVLVAAVKDGEFDGTEAEGLLDRPGGE